MSIRTLLDLSFSKATRAERRTVIDAARATLGEASRNLDDALGTPHFSGRKLERQIERSGASERERGDGG